MAVALSLCRIRIGNCIPAMLLLPGSVLSWNDLQIHQCHHRVLLPSYLCMSCQVGQIARHWMINMFTVFTKNSIRYPEVPGFCYCCQFLAGSYMVAYHHGRIVFHPRILCLFLCQFTKLYFHHTAWSSFHHKYRIRLNGRWHTASMIFFNNKRNQCNCWRQEEKARNSFSWYMVLSFQLAETFFHFLR